MPKRSRAKLQLSTLAIAAVVVFAGDTTVADSFKYVRAVDHVPPPRFRSIASGLPDGLTREHLLKTVDQVGLSAWAFGWLIYGESHSRSIGVALREDVSSGDTSSVLYVDLNRDKTFTENERIKPATEAPNKWPLAIDAEFLTDDNEFDHVSRSVLIRRSKRSQFLEIATAGVMTGGTSIGGRQTTVVRIDRNSNGRWFDSKDRILLDINNDGVVDPIAGRISCDATCNIAGKRYVMQSDLQGETLQFVKLSGTGTIVPQLKLQSSTATITKVSGYVASADGIRAPIRKLNQPIECPVGNYRLESLSLEVANADQRYSFRFSGNQTNEHPIAITLNSTADVDLLGTITLTSQQTNSRDSVATTVQITPTIDTSTGMFLTGSKTGRNHPTLENRLTTESRLGDELIGQHSTGFS